MILKAWPRDRPVPEVVRTPGGLGKDVSLVYDAGKPSRFVEKNSHFPTSMHGLPTESEGAQ